MKERILAVDDDPKLLELIRLFLDKTKRFEVRLENRSAQALAAAQQFHPDLIILDVDMPGKDGGEVARQLKADPVTARTPILFLTSLVSPREAGDSETISGGMPFLAKPVNPTALIAVVDRLLQRRK